MKSTRCVINLGLVVLWWSGISFCGNSGFAEDKWFKQVQPLIESSCLACHDDAEESGLDLSFRVSCIGIKPSGCQSKPSREIWTRTNAPADAA